MTQTRHPRLSSSLRPARPVPPQNSIPVASIKSAEASTSTHQCIPVSVLACSEFDLRFQMDANPAKGEQICVEMLLTDGSTVAAEGVVHWTEMQGSLHEVGIFLTQQLPASGIGKTESNRRTAERYRCRISGRLTSGKNQPECEAVVVNYSYQGLAIRSPIARKVDEDFSFRWIAGDSSRVVSGQIMWQIEQDGGYLMGAALTPGEGYRIAGL